MSIIWVSALTCYLLAILLNLIALFRNRLRIGVSLESRLI